MSSEIAIKVDSINKCYHIYENPRDRLKQFILPRIQRLMGDSQKQYFREFWSLKDVSFEIGKGETVGIIGRNGSGKSTLLQIICGTLTPTNGIAQTNGRIAALLELGSGFNPEFTGRDNIYMSCALLGMTPEETEARFDDIAAFADIGEFIEQPVKTYSSGMYVRLAFAVNIVSKPDIMIVDEALSVGDMNFQTKCMTALTRIQESGTTVLFVSHDIGAVKSLCSRAIYLESGSIKAIGKAPEVAELYIRTMREEMNEEQKKFSRSAIGFESQTYKATTNIEKPEIKKSIAFNNQVEHFRYGTGGARITYVDLLDNERNSVRTINFNQEVTIQIHMESFTTCDISVNFNILDQKKINITASGFMQANHDTLHVSPDDNYIIEYGLKLPLSEGIYSCRALITSPIIKGESAEFIDVIEDAFTFQVMRWEKARTWSQIYLFPTLNIQKIAK